MALIQNDDNKCPTTKQVNGALQSMGGGWGCTNPDFNNTRVNQFR